MLVVTFGSVLEPRGGLPVRARGTIETLARLGMAVDVVSHEEPSPLPRLPSSIQTLRPLRRRLYFGWSLELVREVRRLAAGADAIVVESALLLPAVRLARLSAPIAWDTNECETLHYRRASPTFSNRLRGSVWRVIESWAATSCDVAIAISRTEAEWWRQLIPAIAPKLEVVDHRPLARAVECKAGRAAIARIAANELGTGPVVVFAGNLHAKHNMTAARWMLENLASRLPRGSSLVLAGPGTEALPRPNTACSVLLLGSVPNLDEVIAAADFCLAPLAAGAGVKTKVLHYLAHGKRVIGTPVAFEGIRDAPGLVEAPLTVLSDAVAGLISADEPAAAEQARVADQTAWLARYHSPEATTAQWLRVLARLGIASEMERR